jgi:hypothetical protein
MRNRKPAPTASPPVRQLPLPWMEAEAPPLLPSPPMVRPQEIWASLSPQLQTQVRQTILRVLQEVFHDRAHA